MPAPCVIVHRSKLTPMDEALVKYGCIEMRGSVSKEKGETPASVNVVSQPMSSIYGTSTVCGALLNTTRVALVAPTAPIDAASSPSKSSRLTTIPTEFEGLTD